MPQNSDLNKTQRDLYNRLISMLWSWILNLLYINCH